MSQSNKAMPAIDYSRKAYIDPESIKVVEEILEDQKRKVLETEDLLEIMKLQQVTK